MDQTNKKEEAQQNGWTWKFMSVMFCAYLVIPGISYTISSLNAPAEYIKSFINATKYERDHSYPSKDEIDSLFGLLVALAGLGAMAGSLVASLLSDNLGRKIAILIASLTGLTGVLLLSLGRTASSFEMLFVGRVLTGVTLGIGLSAAPAYAVEMSLPSMKGNVALINQLFQSFSFIIAQVVGYMELLGNEEQWHLLLGLPVIFFGLQLLILPFCPESPRYLLMKKNDVAKATKALQTIRNRKNVEKDIDMLHAELRESSTEAEVSFVQLFKNKVLRRPLVIAIVLGLHQNWCSIAAILFFSTELFQKAGLDDRSSRYATSGTGITFFTVNVVAMFLLSRFGRKTLFQFGTIGMGMCSAVIALTMVFQDDAPALKYVNIVVSLLIIAFYSIGPICVFWVILSELFPHSARGSGFSVAILCAMISFFSHCYIFPLLLSKLHSYTFFVFTGINAVTALFVHFYVPETKNKSFAEIAKSWANAEDLENQLPLSQKCHTGSSNAHANTVVETKQQ
ncbi:solute carrier family 2 facilitated glucose transporter member 1 [Biomphalaria glabrata]|uniref:Solute carrier family 2, facilitated glucose transporter member 3-like n=1 Tax=Biomphalaria glabrata TaxID=6526 RepID=A0A9U8EA83_BIOGL|nr:solute carrier family 2, facilitated glucose transporter member 3-like [Biomphalaria glabrata]XP_013078864.2 solute carrier family 2, facilitated glucose transporter member 3-like [Biomphalaria glabrata]XP_013078871.2 solute carrier family 2, facilitated glucose transporter member 3-like [Biomphalaria glabrata]XP_013078878.2 solute carrier family 2, facilitated glucose transporter member 3-like [Biomphalaria glabrata]KAI8749606.1 solute carrier family 2; facilitated glucose transporter membe